MIKKKVQKFRFFAGFGNHVFFLLKNGELKAVGRNESAELSLGDVKNRVLPETVSFFDRKSDRAVKEVALGFQHAVFLTLDGTWASGDNQYGQLSNSTTKSSLYATKVAMKSCNEEISGVFAGYNSTYLLTVRGTCLSCGSNSVGNLALGHKDDVELAQKIERLSGIIHIAPGGFEDEEYVLFLAEDQTVWICGFNSFGQLGRGSKKNRKNPGKLNYLKKESIPASWVVSSMYTTYFFMENKQVYVTGKASFGEFGNGDTEESVRPIHSKQLSNFDQFCTGKSKNFVVFRKAGKMYGTGFNGGVKGSRYGVAGKKHFRPVEIPELRNMDIVQIQTNNVRTFVICADGTLLGTGVNKFGTLGDGTTKHAKRFRKIGRFDFMLGDVDVVASRTESEREGEMEEVVKKVGQVVEVSDLEAEKKKWMEEEKKKQQAKKMKKAMISFEHIVKGERIGKGGIGTVYSGQWTKEGGEVEVAIKEVHLAKPLTKADLDEFFAMYKCHHPLILQVFGFCHSEKKELLWIIMKKMFTSMFHFIYFLKKGQLSIKEKLKLMKKTTACIQYLHLDKKMLHRDIKSPNFLMNKSGDEVCVTDFGLVKSKKKSSSVIKSEGKGTFQWMAPELFDYPATYSIFSDVYALGMVFYEILNEKVPFSEEYQTGQLGNQNIGRAVMKGVRPKFNERVPQTFVELVERCWASEAKKRPTTEMILKELSEMELSMGGGVDAFGTNM